MSTAGGAGATGQPGPRPRALAAPLAALAAAAAAWAVVAAAQPTDDGRVLCPWRFVTGLDCPFCGSTRAAAALAHGDLAGALDHNAFLVLVLLPTAVMAWGRWVVRARSGRPMPTISQRMLFVGLAVVAVWWVLRLAVPWLGSGTSL